VDNETQDTEAEEVVEATAPADEQTLARLAAAIDPDTQVEIRRAIDREVLVATCAKRSFDEVYGPEGWGIVLRDAAGNELGLLFPEPAVEESPDGEAAGDEAAPSGDESGDLAEAETPGAKAADEAPDKTARARRNDK
jgi:hypothetical protein